MSRVEEISRKLLKDLVEGKLRKITEEAFKDLYEKAKKIGDEEDCLVYPVVVVLVMKRAENVTATSSLAFYPSFREEYKTMEYPTECLAIAHMIQHIARQHNLPPEIVMASVLDIMYAAPPVDAIVKKLKGGDENCKKSLNKLPQSM